MRNKVEFNGFAPFPQRVRRSVYNLDFAASPCPGFSLVEVAVAAAIGLTILVAAWNLLSGGLRSFESGSAEMEAISSFRVMMAGLERDILEGVDEFSVERTPGSAVPENRVLKFTKFRLDAATGAPEVDSSTGFFKKVPVCYRFEDAGGGKISLFRESAGERRELGRPVEEGDFRLLKFTDSVTGKQFIAVCATLGREVGSRVTRLRGTFVPRVIARWAQDPKWVVSSLGRGIDYEVD